MKISKETEEINQQCFHTYTMVNTVCVCAYASSNFILFIERESQYLTRFLKREGKSGEILSYVFYLISVLSP